MLYHGDTEARSKLLHEELTESVIGAAIDVHRALGPDSWNLHTKNVCATSYISAVSDLKGECRKGVNLDWAIDST